MMQAKLNHEIVLADDCMDRNSEYVCPHCNQKVILIKGTFVIDHFRHKVECPYQTEPESEEHLFAKKWFMNNIKKINHFYSIKLEQKIGKHITDVLIDMKYKKVCLEIQCSPISYEDYCSRNEVYKAKGYEVIWIFSVSNYFKLHWRFHGWTIKLKKIETLELERIRKVHYFEYLPKDKDLKFLCYWFKQLRNKETLFFHYDSTTVRYLQKLQHNPKKY